MNTPGKPGCRQQGQSIAGISNEISRPVRLKMTKTTFPDGRTIERGLNRMENKTGC